MGIGENESEYTQKGGGNGGIWGWGIGGGKLGAGGPPACAVLKLPCRAQLFSKNRTLGEALNAQRGAKP